MGIRPLHRTSMLAFCCLGARLFSNVARSAVIASEISQSDDPLIYANFN
jgi:hypothetical protein